MDFEEYEYKIKEKLKIEIEKILSKEDLCIEEIQFLDNIINSMRLKKITTLM